MNTIYVISIVEYSPRHMPVFKHEVGDMQHIIKQLVRFNPKIPTPLFNDMQDVLIHLQACNKDSEYKIVHSYQQQL